MKIRKATKKDLNKLIWLDKKANKEIKWWTPLTKSGFMNFLKRNKLLFIAEYKGIIIGYQSATLGDKTLKLEDIYIRKEFRNKKIATKLIKKAILKAKRYNINQIRLDCPKRLRKFYEKLGFKVTSLIMSKKATP
jgi:ribosomal protein S18 acetylase RimI-like enzyme